MNYTSDRLMTSLFTRLEARWLDSATALRWVMLAVALTAAGCGRPVDGQPTGPGTIEAPAGLPIDPDAPYPPAIAAAIGSLAKELGTAPQAIEVVSYEEVEWPDRCLGLSRPDEACTQAVTPGWRITLSFAAEIHTFRVDAIGAELREE